MNIDLRVNYDSIERFLFKALQLIFKSQIQPIIRMNGKREGFPNYINPAVRLGIREGKAESKIET